MRPDASRKNYNPDVRGRLDSLVHRFPGCKYIVHNQSGSARHIRFQCLSEPDSAIWYSINRSEPEVLRNSPRQRVPILIRQRIALDFPIQAVTGMGDKRLALEKMCHALPRINVQNTLFIPNQGRNSKGFSQGGQTRGI